MSEGMTRRRFLQQLGLIGLASVVPPAASAAGTGAAPDPPGVGDANKRARRIRLFLCGDVMTGRGIDQILPHSASPELYEGYVKDARDYVRLAESANGKIQQPVAFDYVWGIGKPLLDALEPNARILNLETAVTDHDEPWPAKGINYRMSPRNAPVLDAIGADCCVLANNHVLDWRETGLRETLTTLRERGIATAGAGLNRAQARAPAVLQIDQRTRILVFAFGLPTSGIPAEWAAKADKPGVSFLPDTGSESLRIVRETVEEHQQSGDLVVISLHWGGNWGYGISGQEQRFVRGLIDEAGAAIVHGHSSHHPKGIEVHNDRLILYGCGDFLNDYEGIGGYDLYRPGIVAMYLPSLDASGVLKGLDIVPLRIRRMRLERVGDADARWLAETLNEHGPDPGARLVPDEAAFGSLTTPVLRLTGRN